MKNFSKTKTLAIAAFAALTAFATAAAAGVFSGLLSPGETEYWHGTYSAGWYKIEALGYGTDIDLVVRDANGVRIASDTLPDDNPMVEVYLPYAQRLNIEVINASSRYAEYDGVIY